MGKPPAADSGQSVDAAAKIDRLEGQKDPALRGELPLSRHAWLPEAHAISNGWLPDATSGHDSTPGDSD